jgi:glutamate racemase
VVSQLWRRLPEEELVYFGDTARVPYGPKSAATVCRYAREAAAYLLSYGVKLVVIACNTASTIALDHVRSALDVPVVGTVPAIKPAAELSRSRVIGVLGTEATVRQPYVDDLAARFAADCTLVRHGSPELVELAEAKLAGDPVSMEAVRLASRPLFDAPDGGRIDTVVLACTHFPLLADELRAAFPNVAYVDGGAGIARRIADLTREQPWPPEPSAGIFIQTGTAERRPAMEALAAFGLGEVARF